MCKDTALNNELFAIKVVNVRPDIAASLYGYDLTEATSVSREGKLYQHSRDNPWVPEIRWIRLGSTDTTLVCQEFKGEQTLEDFLKENPHPIRVCKIAKQIFEGIAFAHEYGVVHNDIKPSNILIDDDYKPWIIDHNISFYVGETPPRHGHLTYRAPESFDKRADTRSDVWSLGVLLYEMCTGRLPFESDVTDWSNIPDQQKEKHQQQLIERIRSAQVYPPRLHNARLAGDINTLIYELLQKNPNKRPQNAREALQRWENLEKQPKIAIAVGVGISLSMYVWHLLAT